MSFPGMKHGSEHSFGEPKGMATEHEVTVKPKVNERQTMESYANLLHERRGESGKEPKHRM